MSEHPVLVDIRIHQAGHQLSDVDVPRTASPASELGIRVAVRSGPVIRHLSSAQFSFSPPLTLLVTLNMGLLTWFKKVCCHYLFMCVDSSLILSAERA